ncbi:MAG: glycosyltransferase [Actinomycetota bacterium]|nr:glycosyltransferase [Actinomycetota bacterium]
MNRLRLTVVIPTMGRRPRRLAMALEALAGQDLAAGELEVILGCDPGAEAPRAPGGLPVRAITAPSPSSAAAKRNLAWPAACAPLVAFTDDDCRPAAGWAAALLAAHEREPQAFVQGRTEPDPNEADDLWGLAHSQLILRDSPWHETCNIAYPRELLERLGGFDEGYGPLGGEDTDLGARALESGVAKVYEQDALVWHAVEQRSFRQAIRESLRTRDQPQVLARFPQLRGELILSLFYRRGHGLLLVALAGALTRSRVVGALAAIPYLEWHLRHHRLSPLSVARAATHLPVRVLVDAIEMSVVARRGLRRGVIAL